MDAAGVILISAMSYSIEPVGMGCDQKGVASKSSIGWYKYSGYIGEYISGRPYVPASTIYDCVWWVSGL